MTVMCHCHTQPSILCTISKEHIEMLLLLHYNCSIYYDSRTVPRTASYLRTLEAAAFLQLALSLRHDLRDGNALPCTALAYSLVTEFQVLICETISAVGTLESLHIPVGWRNAARVVVCWQQPKYSSTLFLICSFVKCTNLAQALLHGNNTGRTSVGFWFERSSFGSLTPQPA